VFSHSLAVKALGFLEQTFVGEILTEFKQLMR